MERIERAWLWFRRHCLCLPEQAATTVKTPKKVKKRKKKSMDIDSNNGPRPDKNPLKQPELEFQNPELPCSENPTSNLILDVPSLTTSPEEQIPDLETREIPNPGSKMPDVPHQNLMDQQTPNPSSEIPEILALDETIPEVQVQVKTTDVTPTSEILTSAPITQTNELILTEVLTSHQTPQETSIPDPALNEVFTPDPVIPDMLPPEPSMAETIQMTVNPQTIDTILPEVRTLNPILTMVIPDLVIPEIHHTGNTIPKEDLPPDLTIIFLSTPDLVPADQELLATTQDEPLLPDIVLPDVTLAPVTMPEPEVEWAGLPSPVTSWESTSWSDATWNPSPFSPAAWPPTTWKENPDWICLPPVTWYNDTDEENTERIEAPVEENLEEIVAQEEESLERVEEQEEEDAIVRNDDVPVEEIIVQPPPPEGRQRVERPVILNKPREGRDERMDFPNTILRINPRDLRGLSSRYAIVPKVRDYYLARCVKEFKREVMNSPDKFGEVLPKCHRFISEAEERFPSLFVMPVREREYVPPPEDRSEETSAGLFQSYFFRWKNNMCPSRLLDFIEDFQENCDGQQQQ